MKVWDVGVGSTPIPNLSETVSVPGASFLSSNCRREFLLLRDRKDPSERECPIQLGCFHRCHLLFEREREKEPTIRSDRKRMRSGFEPESFPGSIEASQPVPIGSGKRRLDRASKISGFDPTFSTLSERERSMVSNPIETHPIPFVGFLERNEIDTCSRRVVAKRIVRETTRSHLNSIPKEEDVDLVIGSKSKHSTREIRSKRVRGR